MLFALNVIPTHAQTGATTLNWEQVPTTVAPPGREFAAMAYDSLRGRTVQFGGDTIQPGSTTPPAPYFADTWEWDGLSWVNRTPAVSPPALSAAAMAYDSRRGVSVLFGGALTLGPATAGTWEWDGIAWTQRTLGVSPTARVWHAMAYDSARGQVVLFGGDGGGLQADTWTYDGTNWVHLFPATSPPPRRGASMAFDSVRNRIVLFGGHNDTGRLNDTWEWDGMNWTQRFSVATPHPRAHASMDFDSRVGKTILFGGDHLRPLDLGPINDTWQWDGNQWTELWPDAAPAARFGQKMAFDSARGRSVVFGGTNGFGPPQVFYTDTWELGTDITTPPGNPDLMFSQASSFRPTVVGMTSDFAAVRFVSSGTGPVLINSITMSGDFAVLSTDCPIAPNPLAATSVCIVLVTFTPTAVGTRSGTLTLNDNGPLGSVSVTLSAEGKPIPTSLSVATATAIYGGTTTIMATLTANGSPVAGAPVQFTLSNGGSATATTDSTGVATWAGASVVGIHAGAYYGAIQASFAGDDTHLASASGLFGSYLIVGQLGSLAYTGDFYAADTAGLRVGVAIDQRSPASDTQSIDFSAFPVFARFDVVGPGGSSTIDAQVVDDATWSSTGRGLASATLPPLADGAYTVTAHLVSPFNGNAAPSPYLVSEDIRVAIVSSPTKGGFVSGGGAIAADPSANTADTHGYFGLQFVPGHPLKGSLVYAYRSNLNVGGGLVRDVDVWVTSTDVSSVAGNQSGATTTGHFSVTFVDALTGETYSSLGFSGGTYTLTVADGRTKSADSFGLLLNRPDGSAFHGTAPLNRSGKVQLLPIQLGSIVSNL